VIVRLRMSILKSAFVKRSPWVFRAAHGLATTAPPAAITSETSALLMYARSMANSPTTRPCRSMSALSSGIASSSGRLAGVTEQAVIKFLTKRRGVRTLPAVSEPGERQVAQPEVAHLTGGSV
jgi:hypothetical protein